MSTLPHRDADWWLGRRFVPSDPAYGPSVRVVGLSPGQETVTLDTGAVPVDLNMAEFVQMINGGVLVEAPYPETWH